MNDQPEMWVLVAWYVLLCTGGLGIAIFVLVYHFTADWRSSRLGRHLMYFMAGLATLYTLAIGSAVVRATWLIPVFLGVHAAFDVMVWRLLWLTWRLQRAGRQARSNRIPSRTSVDDVNVD